LGYPGLVARSTLWLLALALWCGALSLSGCKKPYRVGEYVWVEWEENGKDYPAYITEQKGDSRFRVHFDGYDSRWDENVDLPRIKGRIEGPVVHPPPPEKVARALGEGPQGSTSAVAVSSYRVGDRVRVRWRGSIYAAIIVTVVSSDQYRVHYEGHESAWDEVVSLDRLVGPR
jgi:hypothetical protein